MRTFIFLIELIIMLLGCLNAVQAYTKDAKRGTNATTRFVRDVRANFVYEKWIGICTLGIIVGLVTAFTGQGFHIGRLAWLPPIVPIPICLYFRKLSTESAQRIKDARVVTKGALKTGAVVGEVAIATGAVAAAPVSGGASVALVAGVAATSKVMDKAADAMTDVESIELSPVEVTSVLETMTPEMKEKFLQAAERSGIPCEKRSFQKIAHDVVRFAPTETLAQLPENLTEEEKALSILGINSKGGV